MIKHGFCRVPFVYLRRRTNFITYAAILVFSVSQSWWAVLQKKVNGIFIDLEYRLNPFTAF